MKVEVVYASVDDHALIAFEIASGTTAHEAIQQSGILSQFPEIDLKSATIGIFSAKVGLDTVLEAGDRVEIYRPLIIDPKDARMARVKMERQQLRK